MDLVDEEHAAGLQRSQKRGDVTLALERRPGGLHERHVELGRDDLRERGLAQPGRAREQQMVERLAARARGLDRDGQLLAQRLLADELLERAAGAASGRARPRRSGRASGCARWSSCARRLGHRALMLRRAVRSACAISSSALSPSGVAQAAPRPRRAL